MTVREDARGLIDFYVTIAGLEAFWHMGGYKELARNLLALVEKNNLRGDSIMLPPHVVEDVKALLRGVISGNTPPLSNFPGAGGRGYTYYKDEILDAIVEAIVKARD